MIVKFPCHNCIVLAACKNKMNCSLHENNEWIKCRYGENLLNVLCRLNTKEIKRINYKQDYQGYVDIDALLDDGRVFSYEYSYGSCSGCDDWESMDLLDADIEKEMIKKATIFDNIDQYNKWRSKVPNEE